MIHLYPFLRKKAALFTMSFGFMCSLSTFGQVSSCGPITENYDNTGNTMAGFTSATVLSAAPGFTYTKVGGDGYLQRCSVSSGGTVYQIVSPSYQSLVAQTAVGYGFELSGIVKVSRVVVLLQYPDNFGNINTVEVENFAPNYSGPTATDVANVCKTVAINSFTGFTPGEGYRIIFQFTAASASNSSQCIIFDDFRTTGVNALAPLPVAFTAFNAKKNGSDVQLTWNVAGEKEVNRYEVERSTNGKDFVKIGEVAATQEPGYTLTDNQPASGVNFYRVKNVDLDGKYKYSSVARINTSKMIVIKAYPQPAGSEVTIEHTPLTGKGSITITSAGGQVVKMVEVKPEEVQTSINISALKAGIYMVRFDNQQGQTETLKLVKQ